MAYTKNASLKSVTELMQSYLASIGHFVLRCCNIHSSYVKIIHNICVLTRPTEATTSKKSRSHVNDVSLEPFDGITLISSLLICPSTYGTLRRRKVHNLIVITPLRV